MGGNLSPEIIELFYFLLMVCYVSLSAGSIQSDIDRFVGFVLGTAQSAVQESKNT